MPPVFAATITSATSTTSISDQRLSCGSKPHGEAGPVLDPNGFRRDGNHLDHRKRHGDKADHRGEHRISICPQGRDHADQRGRLVEEIHGFEPHQRQDDPQPEEQGRQYKRRGKQDPH